jgi:excisionase family DNA binding protein
MPSPGAVLDHVGPGPAQIPHRLLGHGRDADGDQFPGPVQPGQPPAVPTVGLGPCRQGLGISEGAITSQPTPISVEPAAERLGTSVRFVRRLVFQRRIAYVKLGRHVRITTRDLDAFIEAGRVSVSELPAVARKGA